MKLLQSSPTDKTHNIITKPLRTKQMYDEFKKEIEKLETVKEIAEYKTDHGLRNCPNPLFKISMDIFRSVLKCVIRCY